MTWAIGSLAGGALVAAAGLDAAYWINAATFLVSAALLVGIPQRLLQAAEAASRGHWQDLEGRLRAHRSLARAPDGAGRLERRDVRERRRQRRRAEPRTETFSSGAFGFGLMMGAPASA